MDMTLSSLMSLVRYTLQNPRDGARQVMNLGLPLSARWSALLLMALGSTILTHLSMAMMPADQREVVAGMLATPIRTAILQGAVMVVIVLAVHWVGRVRGGQGSLADAVIVVAWLQFILLCLQVVQIAAQLLVPPLADFIGIAGLVLFLWLLTNFVAELHGFRSLGAVFGGIVVTMLGLAFVMAALILVLVGSPIGVT